jgi:hypothetical protein
MRVAAALLLLSAGCADYASLSNGKGADGGGEEKGDAPKDAVAADLGGDARQEDASPAADLSQRPDLAQPQLVQCGASTCNPDQRCLANNLGDEHCTAATGCGADQEECCWGGSTAVGWLCAGKGSLTCYGDTSSPNGTRCRSSCQAKGAFCAANVDCCSGACATSTGTCG